MISESNSVELQKKIELNVQTDTEEAKRLTTEAFGLYRDGQAKKSLPLFLKALKIRREQQGEKHPETLKSIHRYATALVAAGQGPEAEKLFVKVLKLKREVLGPTHPDTIAGIGNLAATIEENGRAEEAEPLHAEALRLRKEILGDTHPLTLLSMNNYASVLQSLGRLSEAEPIFSQVLELRRENLGEEHRSTIGSMNNYAAVLKASGQLDKATQLYSEVYRLFKKTLGSEHPHTLVGLNNYAGALISMGELRDAKPLLADGLALRRKILGPKHPDTISAINNHAFILSELGQLNEAEKLYADTVRLRQQTSGKQHPLTLTAMNNHAAALENLGRTHDAEPVYSEVLKARSQLLGTKHPDTINSMNNYASVLRALGRPKESEKLLAEAMQLRKGQSGLDHPETLTAINNYASILSELGRPVEAEALYREVLRKRRKLLGPVHPDTSMSLNNYASILGQLGRIKEVEAILAEALKLQQEKLGADHPSTITTLSNHAFILDRLGRTDEAEKQLEEAIRFRRQRLGDDHPDTLRGLNNYAGVLEKLGRSDEALKLYERILATRRRTAGDLHPDTLLSLNNYGYALKERGRFDEAEPIYEEALENYLKIYNRTHPDVRLAQTNLAIARMLIPSKMHLAIEPVRSVVSGLRQLRSNTGYTGGDEERQNRQQTRETNYFRLFADAAWARGPGISKESLAAGAKELDAPENEQLQHEILSALQDAIASTASRAVALSAARRFAESASPELGDLARERQNLSDQWKSNEAARVKALSASDDISKARRANLQKRRDQLETRMKEIDDRLRSDAPEYFALVRPEPLSLEEIQNLLGKEDAALLVIPSRMGTHILAISGSELTWKRAKWTSDEVDKAVRRLLWDVGANVEVDALDAANWADEGDGAYPFDRGTAYEMYQQIIEPVGKTINGKRHLFIAASGSLSNLPFGLLVTEPPHGADGDPDQLRSTRWFADEHALVQIPSLQSLQHLRQFDDRKERNSDRPLFFGFGDPILEGKAVSRGANSSIRRSVGQIETAVTRLSGERIQDGASQLRALKNLARLPGTALEIEALSKAFDARPNNLFLAERATEANIRSTDLSTAGVLALATHGLLAGEIAAATEPGLVFTPPETASEIDDGLLTTSEIAALKLNAEWVILSACNTAAGDGSEGAAGLSGIARSFFYAGARNLLASHWPVRDDVAAIITVRTVEISRENPQFSRAEAFQYAMREIRNDSSHDTEEDTWAHPNAWAAFTLVGDR